MSGDETVAMGAWNEVVSGETVASVAFYFLCKHLFPFTHSLKVFMPFGLYQIGFSQQRKSSFFCCIRAVQRRGNRCFSFQSVIHSGLDDNLRRFIFSNDVDAGTCDNWVRASANSNVV